MNKNKKIVMCGCHEGGVLAVRALLEVGYLFDYFVCLTPEQASKYNISGYFDYTPLAEEHDIPVYIPKSYALDADEDIEFFTAGCFDLLVQGGWQRLFPDYVLSSLSIGALGLHGSSDRLPQGRGRSPLNWSLIEGKKRFLMHLFMLSPGVDDGDVIDVLPFDITDHDDIKTLYYKYAISYKQLLLNNFSKILSGSYEAFPQIGEESYYPKRTPEDAKFSWTEMDVWEIYNFIRAQTRPYPGAFSEVDGRVMTIWKARPFDGRIDYPECSYGSIVETFEDGNFIIRCRGGLLLVEEWECR